MRMIVISIFVTSSMMLSISVLSLFKLSWIHWSLISGISLLIIVITKSKKESFPDDPKNDRYF